MTSYKFLISSLPSPMDIWSTFMCCVRRSALCTLGANI